MGENILNIKVPDYKFAKVSFAELVIRSVLYPESEKKAMLGKEGYKFGKRQWKLRKAGKVEQLEKECDEYEKTS